MDSDVGNNKNSQGKLHGISRITETISDSHFQFVIFLTISLVLFSFTVILFVSDPLIFQPYLGNINPVLAFAIIALLGVVLLAYLLSLGWFDIFKREDLKGLLISSILTLPFALAVITIDFNFPYPEDINVLFPRSLLLYPTMGFVVEILFHALPLALLSLLFTSLFKNADRERIILACIFLTAIIEPVYQVMLNVAHPLWIVVSEGIRFFLFSLVQLNIFKRYDFVSMYSFRLVYYFIWHILWGSIRLTILF
ncbi:MAG: hypothetical protein ACFFDM_07990 [Candidatus Thorarchaeota archaeon]